MSRNRVGSRVPRPRWFLVAAVVWSTTVSAQAIRVEDVPSPRPEGWVTDLTGRIDDDVAASIHELGDDVHRGTGAELAVVVVPTTGGRPSRPFAVELFNEWGIGRAEADDGVLIFVALDDRKAEIVLGDGVDDPAREQASQRIMDRVMLPEFRGGRPGRAVLLGARHCAAEILGVEVDGLDLDGANTAVGDRRGLVAMVPIRNPRDDGSWGVFTVVGTLLGVIGALIGGRRILRYRTRRCSECQGPMVRLGKDEEEYLTESERVEQRIRSVDYDIWRCRSCDRVTKLRYPALFTLYSKCPACGARSTQKTTKVIRAADYSQSGLKEITERCKSCTHCKVRHKAIPMRIRSMSSSSGSGSGSGSGFGSGFGGGSSSGGGASGGW